MKKQCSRCRVTKLLTDFYRNKHQIDGYQVWCKMCVREHQNQKRDMNRQEYREYQKEWFANHPGYFRNYSRKPKTATRPLVVFDSD